MNYHLLAGPVIGAAIGYFTNYIAVKMMFRPLHPVKIGSRTLPFTPGIIPRGKSRLAKAIGEAVGKNLLTEESFAETLLSPAIEKHLKEKIRLFLYENRKNEKTFKEWILEYLDESAYEAAFEHVTNIVEDRIMKKILEMELGDIIANEAAKAVRERVRGGIMSFVVTDGLVDSLRESISQGIQIYLEEHAEEFLPPKVEEECRAAMETTVGTLVGRIDDCGLPLDEILWNAYETLVRKKLKAALQRLDISQMVEKKINEMDVEEVENLVLSVMQKELNAIVGLGAVIGFFLGLLNLFL